MDLFEHRQVEIIAVEAPLAARMRPRTLEEFIGQGAIVGEGRLLRRAIQADQLSSLIFYGPPGTGKTTLAQIIANTTKAHFIALNAVLSGVKDIRAAIATAQERRGYHNQRTILFIDEVHRFNTAQQDALLPWVENGTITLIGATTENPYFEVNKALVSRSRLFQLKPLSLEDLRQIAQQALTDPERGYGQRSVQIEPAALDHLVRTANGDARALLNALELAAETTPTNHEGAIAISLAVAEDSIQQRAVLYDKEGDAHFDTISALIKSVRGSDPDAALYWLARMIYAGEDPRFVFRRLLILASEDVGLADPQAASVVVACAAAFDRIGMPEGRYPLAQATLYLATTPKSNSTMGFFDALAAVEREQQSDIPNPLRDANRDKQGFGHGAGYLYPHAYRDHWVAQQYLPASLQGQVFYQPSDQGYEATIQTQVVRRREAQLAALVEGIGTATLEVLTVSPTDSARERWLQRALSQAGDRLGHVRDRLFDLANLQRHHLVLDANAGSGLLTWEAVRRVPEGGVYARVQSDRDALALEQQAGQLPELARPIIIRGDLAELPATLSLRSFDCVVGRNLLLHEADPARAIATLANLLQPTGTIVLAETLPGQSQRLYQLLPPDLLAANLYQQLTEAEEALYRAPPLHWSSTELQQWFQSTGLTTTLQQEAFTMPVTVTTALLNRWFTLGAEPPSYADRLAAILSSKTLETVRTAFKQLQGQTVNWTGAIAWVRGDQ